MAGKDAAETRVAVTKAAARVAGESVEAVEAVWVVRVVLRAVVVVTKAAAREAVG